LSGNIWIGTNYHGFSIFRNAPFTTFTQEDGLSGESVRSVYEDNSGRVWVGTYGDGLYDNAIVSFTEDCFCSKEQGQVLRIKPEHDKLIPCSEFDAVSILP